jgi:hypothetical protein
VDSHNGKGTGYKMYTLRVNTYGMAGMFGGGKAGGPGCFKLKFAIIMSDTLRTLQLGRVCSN